jgi:hypothetical protein
MTCLNHPISNFSIHRLYFGAKRWKKLSESTVLDNVKHELKKWVVWFIGNKMAVNTTKTNTKYFMGGSLNLEGRDYF